MTPDAVTATPAKHFNISRLLRVIPSHLRSRHKGDRRSPFDGVDFACPTGWLAKLEAFIAHWDYGLLPRAWDLRMDPVTEAAPSRSAGTTRSVAISVALSRLASIAEPPRRL